MGKDKKATITNYSTQVHIQVEFTCEEEEEERLPYLLIRMQKWEVGYGT